MSVQSLTLIQIAGVTFMRVWLVFSFILVLGVETWSIVSRENPLLSDDPHIIGLLFAFIATGLAFIYSVANHSGRLVRRKHWIVGIALIVWCLANALIDSLTEGEGDGLGYFIAIGSFVVGNIGWLFCTVRFPAWVRMAVSAMGLAALFVYGYVVLKMNSFS